MMKPSEWLDKMVSSHDIYDNGQLAKDFTKNVGWPASWPVSTYDQTVAAIKKRGLGGTVNPTKRLLAYGWEIAEGIAESPHAKAAGVDYRRIAYGRGTRYRQAVEALVRAGL